MQFFSLEVDPVLERLSIKRSKQEVREVVFFCKHGSVPIHLKSLTLKAPITTEADDIHRLFFHYFSEKMRLDVSSESSARQRIHMKNQALFSLKDKSKKLKCRLLQFLFGALRVKMLMTGLFYMYRRLCKPKNKLLISESKCSGPRTFTFRYQ